MEEKIFALVQSSIAKTLNIDPSTISINNTFEELGLDSLDAVSLIGDLEEELDIQIPNDEILNISSISDAVNTITKYHPQS
jgi:acyl carrier protein